MNQELSSKNMKNKRKMADFLFEAATLKRLKRTGWQILGENNESIAEHSFMVAIISFIITDELHADIEKILLMGLFHDFTETRTGDVYKLADLYVKANVMRAANDAFANLLNSSKIIDILEEYEEEESLEAKIVHDADTLALMLELKQLMEKGNINAKEWLDGNMEVLRLEVSKKLAEEIKKSNSQDWWKMERDKIHRSFKK